MARIKIDVNRPIGAVDPMVFGQFIEHMYRCLYTGIYDEGSPLSDSRGFRTDVLNAAKALRPPILRWPGGNFVSGYHWEDGIGPKDERPCRMELAWGGVESNRFGTDEFIEYCRELDTEPYICINLGTGTLDEARNWLEYCNGTGNTYYANLRRQNGHDEPYNVKYWGLGNEMWGAFQQGHRTAQDYASYAVEAAKLMKRVDPTIKLIGCGHDGISDWDRVVLETLAPFIDYYSIHIYTGSDDYYTNVFEPHHADRCLRHITALIEGVRFRQHIKHPIRIAYDEWNVWYPKPEIAAIGYEQPYNLGDALAVGAYLNIFLRQARTIGMANLAQMVNVLGSMITGPEGLYLQTIYHPLRLYAELCGPLAVDSIVESQPDEQHRLPVDAAPLGRHRIGDLSPFDYLDVATTYDPGSGRLTACVVNRHQESDLSAQLLLMSRQLTGQAQIYEINGASPTVSNSFEQPEAVSVRERAIQVSGAELNYTFPAHSITVLQLQCE
jgi:alpha-L-arabinofuranosidase